MSPTNHKLQLITIAAVLLVFMALPATAQYQTGPQMPPKPSFSDEVTVTATGIETEVDEAPTAVTVVTRDEMDDAQADRVVDMLRRVPGLAVVGSGDAGKLATVFTRGTGSNQTLVMLDGVRLNSAFFGGFDWSRLSTAGLRQAEVVRGPYSALWGADAVGGVINLRAGSASRRISVGAARPLTSMHPATIANRMASSTTPTFRAASSWSPPVSALANAAAVSE
jgi:vitamin B12 transporter